MVLIDTPILHLPVCLFCRHRYCLPIYHPSRLTIENGKYLGQVMVMYLDKKNICGLFFSSLPFWLFSSWRGNWTYTTTMVSSPKAGSTWDVVGAFCDDMCVLPLSNHNNVASEHRDQHLP